MNRDDRRIGVFADALEAAASALPAGDPLAHVFYEDRRDRRLRATDSGFRELASTRSSGGTAVGRISVHLSDPGVDDLVGLARAASEGMEPRAPAGDGRGDEEPEANELAIEMTRLEDWLAGECRSEFAGLDARLVEHHQYIWVCRPGEKTRMDLRRGRRIEIRASWVSGGRTGAAIEEQVLRPGEPPPRGLGELAVERARKRAAECRRSGDRWVDVVAVFAPGAAGVVAHELIGHALEGDIVAAGRSRLASPSAPRLSHLLRVVDDPRRGRAPWAIDDEGSPSAALTLIEDGSVGSLLHDRASALAAGTLSTGHGRRGSYLDRVLPRLGCTYIDRGEADPAAIIADTAQGLFIRRIVAADTAPGSGTATFLVADADTLEHGRLGSALEPFPAFIDLSRSLVSIDAIGDDLAFDRCIGSCVRDGQAVAASVGAPTIRLGVIKALI